MTLSLTSSEVHPSRATTTEPAERRWIRRQCGDLYPIRSLVTSSEVVIPEGLMQSGKY